MNNILNKILIEWDNSDIEDSGIINVSDVANRIKPQLIYKIDEPQSIRIFSERFSKILKNKFKDKVYIEDKHVQLDRYGCTVNVYEPGEYRVYIEDFDKLEELGEYIFWGCSKLTSIIIPDSVTSIGNSAFYGCSGLTSVTIPDSVTRIGMHVFGYCNSLTSITIPNSVTSMGGGTFFLSNGLTSVTIGNSVTSIYADTFDNCTSLTSVTIPNSVNYIGHSAFSGCINLKTIYVENIEKFKKIKFTDKYSNPTWNGAKLIELKR